MPVAIATVPAAAGNPALGQLWKYNETGGYWWSENLSDILRFEVEKRCRFRQFTSMPDPTQPVKHRGEVFHWNIYSELEAAIDDLPVDEEADLPATRMRGAQGQVVVDEYGLQVPYTGKLDDLAAHPVRELIKRQLKVHCARKLDLLAYQQYEATLLKVGPAGGTNFTNVQLDVTGTPPVTNATPLTWAHCKQIARIMRERDIPTYNHGDYYAIGRPLAYSVVEDDLEQIHKYTDPGLKLIRDGEKGRANGIRFVEQTNIDAQYSQLGTPWLNNQSDQVFFFGDDHAAECVVIPEEIRGKIPEGYGRQKGIAWYYLGAFSMTRLEEHDMRCIEWSSAA